MNRCIEFIKSAKELLEGNGYTVKKKTHIIDITEQCKFTPMRVTAGIGKDNFEYGICVCLEGTAIVEIRCEKGTFRMCPRDNSIVTSHSNEGFKIQQIVEEL